MSVLFCFLICSADLYMISLCLLKCFLLSPLELGHLAPSIATHGAENGKPNAGAG